MVCVFHNLKSFCHHVFNLEMNHYNNYGMRISQSQVLHE